MTRFTTELCDDMLNNIGNEKYGRVFEVDSTRTKPRYKYRDIFLRYLEVFEKLRKC